VVSDLVKTTPAAQWMAAQERVVELVSSKVERMVYRTREEWLAARMHGVGGSDAAAVLGVSEWRSRYQLYLEKRRELERADVQSEAARWGLLHERTIAAEYERITGRALFDLGDFAICRPVDRPFMFATHDRIIDAVDGRGPGILSIKTTDKSQGHKWLGDTPAPLDYQIQLQHELSVSGFRWGSFAVLIGGNSFRWLDVERNDSFIAYLVEECYRFASDVEHGRRPVVDASELTSAAIGRLYPRDDGNTVYLPDDAIDWHREREEAMAVIKAAEDRKRLAENRIKEALGAATFGVVAGGRYRFRAHDVAEHTVKAHTKRPLTFEPAKETE
jgi:putative phage-type endonuclease